jgi:hypothetical protein
VRPRQIGVADRLTAQAADFFEARLRRGELAGKERGQRLDPNRLDDVGAVSVPFGLVFPLAAEALRRRRRHSARH